GSEASRHNLDAGDYRETVRDRTGQIYARYEDAGAAYRPRGSGGAYQVPPARDEVTRRPSLRAQRSNPGLSLECPDGSPRRAKARLAMTPKSLGCHSILTRRAFRR